MDLFTRNALRLFIFCNEYKIIKKFNTTFEWVVGLLISKIILLLRNINFKGRIDLVIVMKLYLHKFQ